MVINKIDSRTYLYEKLYYKERQVKGTLVEIERFSTALLSSLSVRQLINYLSIYLWYEKEAKSSF